MEKMCSQLSGVNLDGQLVAIPCQQHACEHYVTYGDEGKFDCLFKIKHYMDNDRANIEVLTLRSSEQARALQEAKTASALLGGPTKELLKLTGLEEDNGRLNRIPPTVS